MDRTKEIKDAHMGPITELVRSGASPERLNAALENMNRDVYEHELNTSALRSAFVSKGPVEKL